MDLHAERIFQVPDGRFSLISRDDGGVLLLPFYSGEPLSEQPPAAFAPDGLSFSTAAVDVSTLPSPRAPVLTPIGRSSRATQNDRLFVKSASSVFEATVAPEVTVRASAYRSPASSRFVLNALTYDAGSWWAGGHDSLDSLHGELHHGEDGASWTQVPGKYDSVKRLVRHGDKLYALWFKNVDEVTPSGLVQVAKLKSHVDDVAFGPTGIVGVGPDIGVGALLWGARRARYSAPLRPRRAGMLASIPGGFLLGDHEGLWASRDGVGWAIVASYAARPTPTRPHRGVSALCASKEHAVVLSGEGEVYTVHFEQV